MNGWKNKNKKLGGGRKKFTIVQIPLTLIDFCFLIIIKRQKQWKKSVKSSEMKNEKLATTATLQ